MTAMRVCPKHEVAHPLGVPCKYCETAPVAEDATVHDISEYILGALRFPQEAGGEQAMAALYDENGELNYEGYARRTATTVANSSATVRFPLFDDPGHRYATRYAVFRGGQAVLEGELRPPYLLARGTFPTLTITLD